MATSMTTPMATSMTAGLGVRDVLGDGRGGVSSPHGATALATHGSLPRPRRGTAPVPRSARELVADAGRVLGRAMGEADPKERFALAHLAALRGAAAMLAARARPRRLAHGNAWDLLARNAPELAEWSAFFAAGARRRQAIVAGVGVAVPSREADDMVRSAAEFLELVDGTLSHSRSGAAGR
jgi:hypothetical protein